MHTPLHLERVKPHEDRLSSVSREMLAVGELAMLVSCHWRWLLPTSASPEPEGAVLGVDRLGFRFRVGLIRQIVT